MEKQICIFRDEQHEETTRRQLSQSQSNAMAALLEFERLTGRKVKPTEFQPFLLRGKKMVIQHFEQTAKVPAGHEKEQYLKLLTYPDCSHLEHLLSQIPLKDYLGFDGETVFAKDSAEYLIRKMNIYLNEAQNEIYKEAQKLCDAANELLEFTRQNKYSENLTVLFVQGNPVIKEKTKTNGNITVFDKYEVDMKTFLSRFLELPLPPSKQWN